MKLKREEAIQGGAEGVKSAERCAGSLSLGRTLTRPLPMLATDFAKCSFCPSLFFVSLGFDPVVVCHHHRQCDQYEAENAGKQIHTIVEESAETSVVRKMELRTRHSIS